jgi:Holliday junction DNA helicase RuvB
MTHHKAPLADDDTIQKVFRMLGIHELGLEEVDIRIISAMVDYYGNRPVGIETLGMAISESAETLEQIYEPYLVQSGIIERTPQGRKLTDRGLEIASRCCSPTAIKLKPTQTELGLTHKK